MNEHDGGEKRGGWPQELSDKPSRLCIMDYQAFFEQNGFDSKNSDLWEVQSNAQYELTGHKYETVCDLSHKFSISIITLIASTYILV